VLADGKVVGRIYEQGSALGLTELRWFWSITEIVPTAPNVTYTGGSAERSLSHWRPLIAASDHRTVDTALGESNTQRSPPSRRWRSQTARGGVHPAAQPAPPSTPWNGRYVAI